MSAEVAATIHARSLADPPPYRARGRTARVTRDAKEEEVRVRVYIAELRKAVLQSAP